MNWVRTSPWDVVVWGFAALGILLRLRQYLFDRSLWLDEALVALNIIRRSPSELLRPLDYHQGAPLGFLALEKAAVLGFGTSEAVLRMVPFLSGVLSVILFVIVSRRFLAPTATIAAVGLFAVSDPLIYFSSEAKQYSSDVAVAILLLWLASWVLERRVELGPAVVISIIGAVAIWFSQPAVFVLAAIGVGWLSDSLLRHDRRGLVLLSIPVVVWPASFLLSFLVSLRSLTHDSTLLDYWQGSFAPFPPKSVADVRWFIDSFTGIFSDPVGLTFVGIAAVAALMGVVELSSKHFVKFLLLSMPVVVTLAASALHRYPFRGRLLLFLVPSLILLIAAGLERILSRSSDTLPYFSYLLTGLLFLDPLLNAGSGLIKPRTKEEIKPVLSYVENRRQDQDVLYLYYSALRPFQYYSARQLIAPIDVVTGVESRHDWTSYRRDLEQLRGKKRAWILFSHVYRGAGVDEERLFLNYLDTMGTRLDSSRAPGASVYLYDLDSQNH